MILVAFALADCPATPGDLRVVAEGATAAFGRLDREGVLEARERLHTALGCVDAVVSGAVVADIHRVEAMSDFVNQDRDEATADFRSALAADPAWVFPDLLAPPGNPFRVLYDDARRLGPGPTRGVPVPAGVELQVDGAVDSDRPSERPAVVQVRVGERLAWSGYVETGAEMPILTGYAPVVEVVEPSGKKRATAAFVGAGGAAVVSAGLYGTALFLRGQYLDPASEVGREESDQQRATANAVGWAGAGTAAVAAGLVGVGLAWRL